MQRKRAQSRKNSERQVAFDAVDIYSGGTISPDAYLYGRDRADRKDSLQKARDSVHKNWFVQTVILLKLAFFNHGLRPIPVQGSLGAKQFLRLKAKVDEWWDGNQSQAGAAEEVEKYVWAVWMERILMNNVISYWREVDDYALTIPPESVDYTDLFGKEVLKIKLKLSAEELKDIGKTSPDIAKRAMKQWVVGEDKSLGEHFRVLKDERVGYGLAWPKMRAIFSELAQIESMEIGEELMAMAMRLVEVQHKIGYEIKTGPNAGSPRNHFEPTRAADILKWYKGKTGGLNHTVTNFDQETIYPTPPITAFDGAKWDSVLKRLVWWGGPLAIMLSGRGMGPQHIAALETEAGQERLRVGLHLEYVVNDAFVKSLKQGGITSRIRFAWSNDCFRDARIRSELMKFGVTQGATSLRTLNEFAGQNAEQERAWKAEEAKLPDDEVLPRFDASHGNDPSNLPKEPVGRKPGTPDP